MVFHIGHAFYGTIFFDVPPLLSALEEVCEEFLFHFGPFRLLEGSDIMFIVNFEDMLKVLPQPGAPICRATMRPPRPSSTAECLCLIARLRGEPASAASWEPRPPFEVTEMD